MRAVAGRQPHLLGGGRGKVNQIRSQGGAASIVALAPSSRIEPTPVGQLPHLGAMGPSAGLAPAPGSREADPPADQRPVDGIEKAVFTTDGHAAGPGSGGVRFRAFAGLFKKRRVGPPKVQECPLRADERERATWRSAPVAAGLDPS